MACSHVRWADTPPPRFVFISGLVDENERLVMREFILKDIP